MKISGFMFSVKQAFLPLILVALATHGAVSAGTVVVTPGSLAGYTYFPKVESSGAGSGGGAGENVSTLQRCLYSPNSGDKTVTVASDMFDYDKDIVLYYRMAGGNGGAGFNGGGGGSSAIFLNGVKVGLGPGGNGGAVAPEVTGFFRIKKGDTLRFMTGGGGGDGYSGAYSVGGGGGAGFTGGGGGASKSSGSIPVGEAANAAGKGGGESPGAGGSVSGGFSGTAGIGTSGGVSTYPSGSSAPVGTAGAAYYNSWGYYDFMGATINENLRHPALINQIGAPNGKMQAGSVFLAGGGGSLGNGGTLLINLNPGYCNGSRASSSTSENYTYQDDNGPCYTWYTTYMYYRARAALFPPHGFDMKLTRSYPEVTNSGNNPQNSFGGSFPGQIITMYQAPVCGILR